MTHEDLERMLIRMAERQQDNRQLLRDNLKALRKLRRLVVDFAERQTRRPTQC